jgi:hypothetical protein
MSQYIECILDVFVWRVTSVASRSVIFDDLPLTITHANVA